MNPFYSRHAFCPRLFTLGALFYVVWVSGGCTRHSKPGRLPSVATIKRLGVVHGLDLVTQVRRNSSKQFVVRSRSLPADYSMFKSGHAPKGFSIVSTQLLKSSHLSFGGISGVSGYGGCIDTKQPRDYPLRFVSDRGWFFYTSLLISGRKDASASLGSVWVSSAISDASGLDMMPPYEDAESITCLGDRSCLVSFEQIPRLHMYFGADRNPQILLAQKTLSLLGLSRNGGFEASLPLDDKYSTLFGIAEDPNPESTSNGDQHLAVWMLPKHNGSDYSDSSRTDSTSRGDLDGQGHIACTATYIGVAGFSPTDAKKFPGSSTELLVLERFYDRKIGNQSRILRVPLLSCPRAEKLSSSSRDVIDQDPVVKLPDFKGTTLAELGSHPHVDNFEGLVVWPHCDEKGYDLGLVSDNNFSSSQETVWLQLRYRE